MSFIIYYIDISNFQFKGLFAFFANLLFVFMYIKASRNLHKSMLASILHCNMQFFESTPIGRIINRFSKDIDATETKIISSPMRTFSPSDLCFEAG